MARICVHERPRPERAAIAQLGTELHCEQLDAAEFLDERRDELPPELVRRLEALIDASSPSSLEGLSDLLVRLDIAMRAAENALYPTAFV